MTSRLPDFVVIGAPKCGTTTLHSWLDAQPEIYMSRPKETRFFSHKWDHGVDWYARIFDAAPPGARIGEASPQYTQLAHADECAPRMAKVVPGADLVYMVRHPIERLLSDYRHNVLLARYRDPIDTVVREPGNAIVGASTYFARLQPYLDRYPREQICVVRFEDMVNGTNAGWDQILDHLRVARRPPPQVALNVTSERRQISPMVGRLGAARRALRLPSPSARARRLIGRASVATSRPARDPLEGQSTALPDDVVAAIWDDVSRLEAWLDRGPLWEREA